MELTTITSLPIGREPVPDLRVKVIEDSERYRAIQLLAPNDQCICEIRQTLIDGKITGVTY